MHYSWMSQQPGTAPGICLLRLWGVDKGRHPLLQTTWNQDNMRGYFLSTWQICDIKWTSVVKMWSGNARASRCSQSFLYCPLDRLHDDKFLTRLAHLGDVFSRLNDLNLGLQGLSTTIFNVPDKIEDWIKKSELFSVCINKDNINVRFFVCKWTQAYGQCQMWYSEAPELVGCAITQVLSRNRWHKQLDWLSLSCLASSRLTDIWTREPHRNCSKRYCEKINQSEVTARFLDWAVSEYPALANSAVKTLMPFCNHIVDSQPSIA